jgi:hypothetical protein
MTGHALLPNSVFQCPMAAPAKSAKAGIASYLAIVMDIPLAKNT